MKRLRLYGILALAFCLWELLFPPWEAADRGARFRDTLHQSYGHQWRFRVPTHWAWDPYAQMFYRARDYINYRLMAYEIALALVALGFALLLLQALKRPARLLAVYIKVEAGIIRARFRNMGRRACYKLGHLVSRNSSGRGKAAVWAPLLLLAIMALALYSNRSTPPESPDGSPASSDLDRPGNSLPTGPIADQPSAVAAPRSTVATMSSDARSAIPPPPPAGFVPLGIAQGATTQLLRDREIDPSAALEPVPPPRSLPTGTRIIPDGATSGLGELTADNGNSLDACLVLIDAASGVRVRKIYIKAGDSFTLKNISPRNYRVYFAIGSDWDSSDNKFKRDASYARFDEPLSFDETDNGRKTEYATYQITLEPVAHGNAKTSPISESEFQKLAK